MNTIPLVLVHLGTTYPEYLVDSIYQALLFNNKVICITNPEHISSLQKQILLFPRFDVFGTIQFVSSASLNDCFLLEEFNTLYSSLFPSQNLFRDEFWKSTLSRFFYLYVWMIRFKVEDFFHIESDVLIYENTQYIYSLLSQPIQKNHLYGCKDAPHRVIASIMYIPSLVSLEGFLKFVVASLRENHTFKNDMDYLGTYSQISPLPLTPESSSFIFDGASIGQFLGGVDARNLEPAPTDIELFHYMRVGRGFINETSTWKPDKYSFGMVCENQENTTIPVRKFKCIIPPRGGTDALGVIPPRGGSSNIMNLHGHCKQLYLFSSVFLYDFAELLSGEKIFSKCDYVIATERNVSFHKNLQRFVNHLLLVEDFENINDFKNSSLFQKDKIRIGVYGDDYLKVKNLILQHFPKGEKQYILYVHNSDQPFTDTDIPSFFKIYAQNPQSQNVSFLPMGIANSMWPHGDMKILYRVMISTYKKKKQKKIYIDIGDEQTFAYRKKIRKDLELPFFVRKSYEEYLTELALHHFCLCVRGNALDTHRVWECLYVGVIPVLVCNSFTNNKVYCEQLEKLGAPVYILKEETITKDTLAIFNKELYQRMMMGKNPYGFPFMNLGYYFQ